jgi:hypothetical protein
VLIFLFGCIAGAMIKPSSHFLVEYREDLDRPDISGPMLLKDCLDIVYKHELDVKEHLRNFPKDPVRPLRMQCFP